jgi:hypothetical protein
LIGAGRSRDGLGLIDSFALVALVGVEGAGVIGFRFAGANPGANVRRR